MQNPTQNSDVINLGQILEQIGGDSDLLREVIRVFLGDSPNIRRRLADAFAKNDVRQLREIAHSAKSAVGNFCTEKGVAAASELEEACKNGDTRNLEKLTESLNAALIEVEDALRAALDKPF